MAIGYTELDFIDGQAPAISAANLNHIDEGVKACADQLDAETAPGRALVEAADVAAQRAALGLGTAALAGDASESAKGVVQLGATGVPSATKVPKALGADLVALITAAGYTLSPAEGAASLDGIADGTTYKRVLAAIATALNAGTFDAASVGAYGIGNTENAVFVSDCDAVVKGGAYLTNNTTTHYPSGASPYGTLLVSPRTTTTAGQIYISILGEIFFRWTEVGTPGTWYPLWNPNNDGNGGQPPAPKQRTDTSTWLQGSVYHLASADNTQLDTPNPTGGSTWYVSNIAYQNVSTGVLTGITGISYALILSGGAKITNAVSGQYGVCDVWRIA